MNILLFDHFCVCDEADSFPLCVNAASEFDGGFVWSSLKSINPSVLQEPWSRLIPGGSDSSVIFIAQAGGEGAGVSQQGCGSCYSHRNPAVTTTVRHVSVLRWRRTRQRVNTTVLRGR